MGNLGLKLSLVEQPGTQAKKSPWLSNRVPELKSPAEKPGTQVVSLVE